MPCRALLGGVVRYQVRYAASMSFLSSEVQQIKENDAYGVQEAIAEIGGLCWGLRVCRLPSGMQTRRLCNLGISGTIMGIKLLSSVVWLKQFLGV